jgi:hypothetical protein
MITNAHIPEDENRMVCTPWNPKDSRDIVLEIPKEFLRAAHPTKRWIPACAGMTKYG